MMNTPIPSKQALRHLQSLCAPHRTSIAATRAVTSCPSRKAHTSRSPPLPRETPRHPSQRNQATRPFSHTPCRPNEPARPLPDITNHYTLFPHTIPEGPPPRGAFDIHTPSLRQEFLHLQGLHHPDKYPHEPAHSKALALSALINTSYRTLADPLLRAQYLLRMKYDIDVMSEDNSSHPTDQATLIEVMEAQERIEEASSHAEIDVLLKENKARIEETTAKLAEAFDQDDAEHAKSECVRLNYWRSLQDGLKDWEPGKEVRLIH